MPFGRLRPQPSVSHLLPVLDPTSDFDSLWGDASITHPLGSAYLGLYKTEVERMHTASNEISNLSSRITLVDDSFPRKMTPVVAKQDDTNISFFEDGGLTLSPSSWFRSMRKKRRPRSAPEIQPAAERLYSPSLKYHFSNTTDTPWRTRETHNTSFGTIGTARGYYEETTHAGPSTDSFSFALGRKQSPSSESNEGLNSWSSQSPVSVNSSEPESLPTNLVNSYKKLEDVASQSQSQSVHIHDNFDSLDGKVIAVSPTCKVFTTEDEIFSEDEVSKWHKVAIIDGAIPHPHMSQSRLKAPVTTRLSTKRTSGKSLVIATTRSVSPFTTLKSPPLSAKSVRFDIPENDDMSNVGDVLSEAGLRTDKSTHNDFHAHSADYVMDNIYKNPWLEPNTPPPHPRDTTRIQSLPSSPGILRHSRSKHPSLAVTGIMRTSPPRSNKLDDTNARDAALIQLETPEVSTRADTSDHPLRPKLTTTSHGLPSSVIPTHTGRLMSSSSLTMQPRLDPRNVSVKDRAIGSLRSKSLSDIPTYSSPVHGDRKLGNGNKNYPQTAGRLVDRPHFI